MVTARETSAAVLTKADVMAALAGVSDPEIPAISIVDLGLVEDVRIEGRVVEVDCLPTFVGCPALDAIKEDVEKALAALGAEPKVRFVFTPAWTSDRITEQGRDHLRGYGLAPPVGRLIDNKVSLTVLKPGPCPFCGSSDTVLESPFGPTACRATCYCRACRNPYEQFKPV